MKNSLIYFFVVLLLVSPGCQEEDDCVGCGIEPTVTVRFDPSISKKSIEAQLVPIYARIKVLRDSLTLSLPDEIVTVITTNLQQLRQDSTTLNEPLAYFKTGKIRLSSVRALGTPDFEQWQDTVLNTAKIPVDMLHDSTIYFFNYHEHLDTLQVRYEREIVQTLTGMRMTLHHLSVDFDNTSFDSLIFKCPGGKCTNDRASINILF